jgi:hypothetical protein
MSPRNILFQPGPLHLPPSQRSLKDPSFRIIDLGRGLNVRADHGMRNLDLLSLRSLVRPERLSAGKMLGMKWTDVSYY